MENNVVEIHSNDTKYKLKYPFTKALVSNDYHMFYHVCIMIRWGHSSIQYYQSMDRTTFFCLVLWYYMQIDLLLQYYEPSTENKNSYHRSIISTIYNTWLLHQGINFHNTQTLEVVNNFTACGIIRLNEPPPPVTRVDYIDYTIYDTYFDYYTI